jgi:hypothetical protein
MPDFSDKVRSFIEKMIRWVPGYTGYADKESRRNTDKLLRMHLAAKLEESKTAFDSMVSGLSQKPEALDLLNTAGSVTKLLEKLVDRLKLADYGYAGFFDGQKIMEPQLDALYKFDQELAVAITAIRNKVTTLTPDQASLFSLLSDLQAFDATLNARHEAITTTV